MASMRIGTRLLVLALIALMAACAPFQRPVEEPPPVEERPAPPPEPAPPPPVEPHSPPRAPTPSASAAWQPLLEQAEEAIARGDHAGALALLERAQRIDPDSAEVYLATAGAHRARGDAAQARATAERGLLYCSTQALCDALRAYAR